MKDCPRLVLASTSRYRQQKLEQLGLTVESRAPVVAEKIIADEAPHQRADRLSRAKASSVARAMATQQTGATGPWIVLGADQVCHTGNEIYRKPGNFSKAQEQLQRFSGCWVSFTTSITLECADDTAVTAVESFQIKFRHLANDEIARYLERDQPFECAGAIRAERLGITLLEDTRGRDINVLYGLPLMALTELLAGLGYGL